MEIKSNIPVSNHGLHRHPFSCPTLTTHGFFDVFPIYCQRFYKGEKTNFDLDLFGRTNPFVQAAMVTGKYVIRKFFVPHRLVMRSWYDFDQGKNHVFSDSTHGNVQFERYCLMNEFSRAFLRDTGLCTLDSSTNNPDIAYASSSSDVNVIDKYILTQDGKRLMRVLRSLGFCPTFDIADNDKVSVLSLLEWCKLYIDWMYPSQYIGDNDSSVIESLLNLDTVASIHVDPTTLILALKQCLTSFYDQSIFDFAWDTPVSPNTFVSDGYLTLSDITQTSGTSEVQYDPEVNNATPTAFVDTENGNGISQYLLDGLQSINNYVRRHQLAGNRLAERFYAERGQKLASAIVGRSLYLGEDSISLRVGDVEANNSNSDVQLGELAGKGVISSKEQKISINDEFSEDGLLIVSLCAVPDCPPILYCHPDIFNVENLSHYHGAYDKLGTELIRQKIVFTSDNGAVNRLSLSGGYGFLNRYYGELYKPGRLLGDFINGSTRDAMSQFHGFRLLRNFQAFGGNVAHSKDFVNTRFDGSQFNRFFYSGKTDNLITLIWFTGNDYKFKLPLGQSFDWDDDEENQKVTVSLKNN